MSNNQTVNKLNQMKMHGMVEVYQLLLTSSQAMTNDEFLTYLVESEWDRRENLKLARNIKNAKFRYQSTIEDIEFYQDRNLDKTQLLRLAQCGFLDKAENVIITGATGVGKSHIATALGKQACTKGYKTLYCNVNKLLSLLKIKRADSSHIKEIEKIARYDLIILDDFGLAPIDAQSRLDLLEIIEDRHGKKSTIITSQIPINLWHDVIADSTIADAILDRIVHNSVKIELKGMSLRKKRSEAQEKI